MWLSGSWFPASVSNTTHGRMVNHARAGCLLTGKPLTTLVIRWVGSPFWGGGIINMRAV